MGSSDALHVIKLLLSKRYDTGLFAPTSPQNVVAWSMVTEYMQQCTLSKLLVSLGSENLHDLMYFVGCKVRIAQQSTLQTS